MRNSISKTVFTSLATLTIGLATLGAVIPASADVYSGRNGQTPAAFSTDGVVMVGGSPAGVVAAPAPESFTAIYGPAKSCAPVITRHQKTDTIDYPAPGSC